MHSYQGSELPLFALATNWKRYVATTLRTYIGCDVLEVGAGLGVTTRALRLGLPAGGRWTCLEPDPELAAGLAALTEIGELGPACRVVRGTVSDLGAAARYDTVIYLDVLEHILDDRSELHRAAGLLASGGHLIVLAPAFPWLFTEFDAAIGHFRRYTRRSLRILGPREMALIRGQYLDSVGLLVSAANRVLLKSHMPSGAQIALWDKVMVPLSRHLDPLFRHSFGRSVVCIWTKE